MRRNVRRVALWRCFSAVALLSLFAGLARAQTPPFQCQANKGVPPSLRGEGYTELAGDILITCTGGSATAPGTSTASDPNLQGNITVILPAPITSRPIGSETTANFSEALLLIDEPSSPVGCSVSGASAPALTAATSCPQIANLSSTGGIFGTGFNAFSGQLFSSSATGPPNQVTFLGIPVLPPVTAGISRVFRITNVRINASAALAGSPIGATIPIDATVIFNSNAQRTLFLGTVPLGTVIPSLGTGVSISNTGSASLTYTEGFAEAFKTRVADPNGMLGNNAGTESGYVPYLNLSSIAPFIGAPNPGADVTTNIFDGTSPAGLADFGTRLKAVFNNVPPGATIWAATTNTAANSTAPATPGVTAQLTASETGVFSPVPGTTTLGGAPSAVPLAALPNLAGTSTAIWEITIATPGVVGAINIPFLISGGSLAGVTVTQEYGPTAAPGTAAIPRFAATGTPTLLVPPQPPASTGLTVTNYQLIGVQPASGGASYFSYRADLFNPSNALGSVVASLTSLDPFDIRVAPGQGVLNFRPVQENSLTTSSNTFTIIANASQPVNFSALDWTFQSTPAPPAADAGPNQTVSVGSTVTLNASGSTNPSGMGTLTYSWMFGQRPPGSAAVLYFNTAEMPFFTPDVPGSYVVVLTVSNGVATSTASATITVAPSSRL